jgi:uncharacterized protein HemX
VYALPGKDVCNGMVQASTDSHKISRGDTMPEEVHVTTPGPNGAPEKMSVSIGGKSISLATTSLAMVLLIIGMGVLGWMRDQRTLESIRLILAGQQAILAAMQEHQRQLTTALTRQDDRFERGLEKLWSALATLNENIRRDPAAQLPLIPMPPSREGSPGGQR